MAGRTAKIKITLSSGAFTGEIKKTEQKVKAAGKRMGKSVGKELDSGFKRGTNAMKSMGKSMGRMIKQVGTIGAAFATGALLKDSVEIHKSFQDISFLLSKVPGQAMSWQEAQDLITGAANRTTRTTKEMADAFQQVYKATGDLDYAKESLDMIGKAATATGAPIEQIAQISEMVRRKWNVTGKEAEDMLAKFIEKADKGGLSLDGLSSRLDMVAGVAATMGMDATELLGTIQQLDATMGAMAPRGMKTLLEYMREGTTQAQQLEKAGKFKFDPNMDALERIRMIIKSPKAHKEALKVFTETSRTAFDELRKPYTEALDAAKAQGMTQEQAEKKALEAYDGMVRQIRKTEMTAADIDRIYEKRASEDPSVKMREALNKIRDAFAQPKMIESITKLADKLPALAKVVADIVGFIADNPLGAAGVGMGMRVGLPMMMQGAQFRGRGGIGFGGAGAGVTGAGSASRGVSQLGGSAKGATRNINGMGASAGNAIGQFAGAAALAYTMGKAVESMIDAESEAFDLREKSRQKVSDVYLAASGDKATPEAKMKAIEAISRERQKAESQRFKSTGMFDQMRMGAEVLSGDRKFGDLENKDAARTAAEFRKKEERLRNEAHDSIIKRMEDETRVAKSAKDVADSLEKMGKALQGLANTTPSTPAKGGGGARGPRKSAPSVPGSEPAGG